MSEQTTLAAKVHGIADAMIDSKPTTLADMSPEERAASQWMFADVEGDDSRVVILDPCWRDGGARLLWPCGFIKPTPTDWEKVTPRPDVAACMTWPDDQEADQ